MCSFAKTPPDGATEDGVIKWLQIMTLQQCGPENMLTLNFRITNINYLRQCQVWTSLQNTDVLSWIRGEKKAMGSFYAHSVLIYSVRHKTNPPTGSAHKTFTWNVTQCIQWSGGWSPFRQTFMSNKDGRELGFIIVLQSGDIRTWNIDTRCHLGDLKWHSGLQKHNVNLWGRQWCVKSEETWIKEGSLSLFSLKLGHFVFSWNLHWICFYPCGTSDVNVNAHISIKQVHIQHQKPSLPSVSTLLSPHNPNLLTWSEER